MPGYSYIAAVGTTAASCATTTASNCTITNCTSCYSSTLCSWCASGFSLNRVGGTTADTCVTGVANCWVGNATVCTTCNAGYYSNAGGCTKSAALFLGKLFSLLLVFIL